MYIAIKSKDLLVLVSALAETAKIATKYSGVSNPHLIADIAGMTAKIYSSSPSCREFDSKFYGHKIVRKESLIELKKLLERIKAPPIIGDRIKRSVKKFETLLKKSHPTDRYQNEVVDRLGERVITRKVAHTTYSLKVGKKYRQ